MLLAACSVADATVDLLADATGVPVERVVELLEGPEREGIVRIDGNSVRFAHPLLARGIYTHAGPARRRRMHRALAAVEAQPELKARHMALGAASAEPATLHALDDAAAAAVGRGAAAAAADLYELAIGLGGDTPDPSAQRGRTTPAGRRDPSGPPDARAGGRRTSAADRSAPPRSTCSARPGWPSTTTPGALPLLAEAVDRSRRRSWRCWSRRSCCSRGRRP